MTNTDWISVQDRLPPPDCPVLTSRKAKMYSMKRTISVDVCATDILSRTVEQWDEYWVKVGLGV